MESISPSRVISKYASSFQENKESFNIRRKVGLSKVLNLTQYTGLLSLGNKSSPNLSLKIIKPKTTFFQEISEICQKLDPNFKIEQDGANCYNMIKETLTKAVDLVLKHDKLNLRDELFKIKAKNCEMAKIIERNLKEIKELKDKQGLLDEKQKTFEECENRLKAEQKMFIMEKNYVNSTKRYFAQLENEIKQLRLSLKEQKIYQNPENSIKFRDLQLYDTNNTNENSKSITENQNFSSNLKQNDLKNIFQVAEGKLKIDIDQSLTKNKILTQEDQEFIKAKHELADQFLFLSKQKQEIEEQKLFIDEIQNNFANIELQLQEREKNIKLKEEEIELKLQSFSRKSESEFSQLSCQEIESVLIDLQRQIDQFNLQVSTKEQELKIWEEKLAEREKKLENKINLLKVKKRKNIQNEIERSVSPRYKDESKIGKNDVSDLIKELVKKKEVVEKKAREINEEFKLIQIVKTEIDEIFDQNIEQRELSLISKFDELNRREKEIQIFKVSSDVDKIKIKNAVDQLKKERIRLETEKSVKDKELNLPITLLSAYNKKLADVINLIRQKEIEISSFS